MSRHYIKWLDSQLPLLEQEGILESKVSLRIQGYYAEKGRGKNSLNPLFAVLGASLIGLGFILIMALNWGSFPRSIRIILAFLPLLLSQAMGIRLFITRRWDTFPYQEGLAIFMFLASGTAIALVQQIYHIPGELDRFLLTWMLISLPLIYLFRSRALTFCYFIGIIAWATIVQNAGGQALFFWVFFAAVLPFLLKEIKNRPYSSTSLYLGWTGILCLSAALGITLEKIMPGLWILVYTFFFTNLYLLGRLYFSPTPASNPYLRAGSLGIVSLAYLLTYSWPWDTIGWREIRKGGSFHAEAAIGDYILCLLLLGFLVYLAVMILRRRIKVNYFLMTFPITALLTYFIMAGVAGTGGLIASHLILNFHILAIGLSFMLQGFSEGKESVVSTGVLIIVLLIVLRFVFVEDLLENLLVRGSIFILTGTAFLITNHYINRKFFGKKKHG